MSIPGGPDPAPKQAWRVDLRAEKNRICVVLSVDDQGRYEVAYGRGRPEPNGNHVKVEQKSPFGFALRLTKDTHFWAENVGYVFRENLTQFVRNCPPGLFLELEELAESPACSVRLFVPRASTPPKP
jgi:hypothetical protein